MQRFNECFRKSKFFAEFLRGTALPAGKTVLFCPNWLKAS
jgi:hypothetical protein